MASLPIQFSPKASRLPFVYLLLIIGSFNALAQFKLPVNELGQVQYQEIVRVPDNKRSARKLMDQVRAWAEPHYASKLTTEQQYDQENNILFIKSSYLITNQIVRYTLTIEPKFGRYRATLTDLITESNGLNVPIQATSATVSEMVQAAGKTVTNKKLIEQAAQQQADLYREIDKSCRATLASLKQGMTATHP